MPKLLAVALAVLFGSVEMAVAFACCEITDTFPSTCITGKFLGRRPPDRFSCSVSVSSVKSVLSIVYLI